MDLRPVGIISSFQECGADQETAEIALIIIPNLTDNEIFSRVSKQGLVLPDGPGFDIDEQGMDIFDHLPGIPLVGIKGYYISFPFRQTQDTARDGKLAGDVSILIQKCDLGLVATKNKVRHRSGIA